MIRLTRWSHRYCESEVACDQGHIGSIVLRGQIGPLKSITSLTKANRFKNGPFLYSKFRVELLIFTLQQLKPLKSSTKLNLLKLRSKVTTSSPLLTLYLYVLTRLLWIKL
jgi:hypothetical protein